MGDSNIRPGADSNEPPLGDDAPKPGPASPQIQHQEKGPDTGGQVEGPAADVPDPAFLSGLSGSVRTSILSVVAPQASPGIEKEIAELQGVVNDIAALDDASFRNLMAFLMPLRGRRVDMDKEVSGFLTAAQYPQTVQDILRRIAVASHLPSYVRYAREARNINLDWITWARAVHRGVNLLNPAGDPERPTGFSLHFAEPGMIYIENGGCVFIRRKKEGVFVQWKNNRCRLPNDGSIVIAGRSLDISDLFGLALDKPLHIQPDLCLELPYSRAAIQFRLVPGRNEVQCFVCGSAKKVHSRDPREKGERVLNEKVVERPDGQAGFGESQLLHVDDLRRRLEGEPEVDEEEPVNIRRPQDLPDVYPAGEQGEEKPPAAGPYPLRYVPDKTEYLSPGALAEARKVADAGEQDKPAAELPPARNLFKLLWRWWKRGEK